MYLPCKLSAGLTHYIHQFQWHCSTYWSIHTNPDQIYIPELEQLVPFYLQSALSKNTTHTPTHPPTTSTSTSAPAQGYNTTQRHIRGHPHTVRGVPRKPAPQAPNNMSGTRFLQIMLSNIRRPLHQRHVQAPLCPQRDQVSRSEGSYHSPETPLCNTSNTSTDSAYPSLQHYKLR